MTRYTRAAPGARAGRLEAAAKTSPDRHRPGAIRRLANHHGEWPSPPDPYSLCRDRIYLATPSWRIAVVGQRHGRLYRVLPVRADRSWNPLPLRRRFTIDVQKGRAPGRRNRHNASQGTPRTTPAAPEAKTISEFLQIGMTIILGWRPASPPAGKPVISRRRSSAGDGRRIAFGPASPGVGIG